jgi:squalene cyclase
VPGLALDHLKGLQQPDGGWEWDTGWGSDTNSTALAIQSLAAAGEPAASPVIIDGLDYLEGAQNDDGGFPYSPVSPWGTDSDTNSTAFVVQALLAAGDSPTDSRWLTYTNGITPTNPISFLLSMQLADGSFEWQPGAGGDRQASTRQAITALLGRPFPLEVAELDNCRACYLPIIRKSSP